MEYEIYKNLSNNNSNTADNNNNNNNKNNLTNDQTTILPDLYTLQSLYLHSANDMHVKKIEYVNQFDQLFEDIKLPQAFPSYYNDFWINNSANPPAPIVPFLNSYIRDHQQNINNNTNQINNNNNNNNNQLNATRPFFIVLYAKWCKFCKKSQSSINNFAALIPKSKTFIDDVIADVYVMNYELLSASTLNFSSKSKYFDDFNQSIKESNSYKSKNEAINAINIPEYKINVLNLVHAFPTILIYHPVFGRVIEILAEELLNNAYLQVKNDLHYYQ